ncbi:hypothetical protein EDB69_2682 [Vibrio crassostreae]|nr:hypothetical protein EDB64_1576 [Vibrio crassostreae]ROP10718.1 hypothetical protein EDB63_2437 [Vibrio crassostreae]ROQ80386.1 hypothetical protein EDB72_3088 [Vibrio crassostreae]ROR85556.1 hypothetical protein EDB66_2429 [Vibrio crassostreae]RPE93479.1 hypothetical protein EDB68_2441 [Vibrio crassostreae]
MKRNNSIRIDLTLYTILFIFMCYIFSPGFMTKDSIVQLYQAEQGIIDDWHPPVMSWLWSYLLAPLGVGGMLYLQLFLLFSSSYLMHRIFEESKFSYIFLCVPFLPWIFNFGFVIWKDVALAYTWFLSVALALFYSRSKGSKLIVFLIFSLFLYGILVRSNSPAGAIFVLPFLLSCIFKLNVKKSITISSIVIVLYFIYVPKLFNDLLGAKNGHGFSYTMIDDIVAIRLAGGQVSDSSLFSYQEINKYKKCNRLKLNNVGAGICNLKKMKDLIENDYKKLKEEWKETIKNNFTIYLKYRISIFIKSLRDPQTDPYYYYEKNLLQPPYYIVGEENFNHVRATKRINGEYGQLLVENYITSTEKVFSFIFKPYFWVIFSFLQFIYFTTKRGLYRLPFWMLPLSSISYVSGYIPFTQAHDLRYFYYSIVMTTICSLLILVLTTKPGVYFSGEKSSPNS